jgi:ERCC4-type nuclease
MLDGLQKRLHPDGDDSSPFADIVVKRTKLPVGDYYWTVKQGASGDTMVERETVGDTIVERKTILDLAGRSARKDHLRQILRMLRTTVKCPLLLIEGDAQNTIAPHATVYDQQDGCDVRLDVHALIADLVVRFEGRLKVVRTNSVEGTYDLLVGLTALVDPDSPAQTLDDFKRRDKLAKDVSKREPNTLNQQLQSANVGIAHEVAFKAAEGLCERFSTNEELREALQRADRRCQGTLLAPCLGGDLLLAAQVCAAALGQPSAAASSLRAEAPRRARVSVHTGWRADLQRALDAEAVVEFEDFEPGEEAAGTEGALSLLTVHAVHGDARSELHEIVILPERARRQCVLLRAWLHEHVQARA